MIPLLRIALTASALSLCLVVAGCENFDPTSVFDAEIFNTKKKLPGDRRPVFPEGTPGVPQGVPEELVKGYQPGADADQDDSLAQKVGGDDQSKNKPKGKPKPKVAAKPAAAEPPSRPTPITVRRSDAQAGQSSQQQPAAEQWPDPTPAGQKSGTAQWPDAPRQGTSSGVQWPDPQTR